jgi:MscS family membrane protein
VEVFAYVSAHDWSNFLEIQEELLFGIIEIVHIAGTGIAFPSQTLYVAADSSQQLTRHIAEAGNQTKAKEVPDEQRVLSGSF